MIPRTFDVAGLPPSAVTDAELGDRSGSSKLHRGYGASSGVSGITVRVTRQGWSTFDSTPSFDSTPWQYRAADNLQGGKVFGYMAKWLGEAAGPVAKAAGTLMRGVARLDPASIIIVGLLVGGANLVFFYTRKFIAYRSRETLVVRPIKVSDARLYSRYKRITTALEEIGIVREPHETPKQYARRAAHELDEPGMTQLGEIYLYARFRNAVPSSLVEEFDRLEPQTLAAIEQLKDAQTVSMSARSSCYLTRTKSRGTSRISLLRAVRTGSSSSRDSREPRKARVVFPKSSCNVPMAEIKYKSKRAGSSSLSSSETHATGSSLRWLQSVSRVVLPKPAGAETTVSSRLAPSSRRERGTAFARLRGT